MKTMTKSKRSNKADVLSVSDTLGEDSILITVTKRDLSGAFYVLDTTKGSPSLRTVRSF